MNGRLNDLDIVITLTTSSLTVYEYRMNPSTVGFLSGIPSVNQEPNFFSICSKITTTQNIYDIFCPPYTYGRYFAVKVNIGTD